MDTADQSRPFIHDDFLLGTGEARELYHRYAAGCPIIDFHCHLPPAELATDQRWAKMILCTGLPPSL